MQWLTVMICFYAGVARARTEEDQASSTNQASTPNPVPEDVLPEQCFYQQPKECPSADSGECPCKRIVLSHTNPEESAVVCCNLNSHKAFEEGLACTSEYLKKIPFDYESQKFSQLNLIIFLVFEMIKRNLSFFKQSINK